MKWLIVPTVTLISATAPLAQYKRSEKRVFTEDGVTKSWEITEEYDAEGNLIDSDTVYRELGSSPFQEEDFSQPNDELQGNLSFPDGLFPNFSPFWSDTASREMDFFKLLEDWKDRAYGGGQLDSLGNYRPYSDQTPPESDRDTDGFIYPKNQRKRDARL